MKFLSKYTFLITLVISISLLHSQEIVDNTIDQSVEASNISMDAQLKIEELDEISKKLYLQKNIYKKDSERGFYK